MVRHDEMASVVNGLTFMRKFVNKPTIEVSMTKDGGLNKTLVDEIGNDGTKLLVSCGSGVSVLRVENELSYERVNGTMIGGGTLVGLANMMTGINDFDTIIKLAAEGDNTKVDMLVKDIYGNDSPFKELGEDLLASSFAKMATATPLYELDGRDNKKYNKSDVLNSLVTMISINIGRLACTTAEMQNINQIYFVGNLVKHNELA